MKCFPLLILLTGVPNEFPDVVRSVVVFVVLAPMGLVYVQWLALPELVLGVLVGYRN